VLDEAREELAEELRESADAREPAQPVVDPRPLGTSPVSLTPPSEHRGEVWLAIGKLPVNARQVALVMSKLPVGTLFAGIEPDVVNGEGCMRLGFLHWSFAAADAEKYPNGPRLWVSWENDNTPHISWPLVDE
jgi:hypothetical protein